MFGPTLKALMVRARDEQRFSKFLLAEGCSLGVKDLDSTVGWPLDSAPGENTRHM